MVTVMIIGELQAHRGAPRRGHERDHLGVLRGGRGEDDVRLGLMIIVIVTSIIIIIIRSSSSSSSSSSSELLVIISMCIISE